MHETAHYIFVYPLLIRFSLSLSLIHPFCVCVCVRVYVFVFVWVRAHARTWETMIDRGWGDEGNEAEKEMKWSKLV